MQVPVAAKSISDREVREAKKALDELVWTEGHYCIEFAELLKLAVNRKYCQLVNSGSSANFIALASCKLAFDWKDKDEVITCALGFPTTVAPIIQLGLKPVFVDAKGLNIDTDLIEQKIGKRTRAIMIAHTLGFPFDYKKIKQLCNKYGLKLIEDTCLVEGTKITTNRGPRNIEDIERGDMVLTRKGYRMVLDKVYKGERLVFKNLGITATNDHKIITDRGNKEFTKLRASDTIYIWNEKQSFITEVNIIDILTLMQGTGGYITQDIMEKFQNHYTEKFGKIILEKFLRGLSYTTRTGIPPIINFRTLKYLAQKSTPKSILKNRISLRRRLKTLKSPENLLLNGISRKRGESSMLESQNYPTKTALKLKNIVPYVGKNIIPTTQTDQNSALKFVSGGTKRVYDLKVEDAHEFFANNILVHNCDAVGGRVGEMPLGSLGDVSTFSFYPAHSLTTIEGGGVVTDNIKIFAIARSLTNWGRACYCVPGHDNTCGHRFDYQLGKLPKGWDHKYTYLFAGWNLKMNDIEAAIGTVQIKKLDNFVQIRRSNYIEYSERIIYDCEPLVPGMNPFGFVIYSDSSIEFLKKLTEKGIGGRLVMGGNLLRQPFLKDYDNPDNYPGADKTANTAVWIGVQPNLSMDEKEYVVKVLNNI